MSKPKTTFFGEAILRKIHQVNFANVTLDPQMRQQLQKELQNLWLEEKKTVVMVTHEVDEAVYLSDRIIVLSVERGLKELADGIQIGCFPDLHEALGGSGVE